MIIREAVRADLPAAFALLADDVLGRARDHAEVDDAGQRADQRRRVVWTERSADGVRAQRGKATLRAAPRSERRKRARSPTSTPTRATS